MHKDLPTLRDRLVNERLGSARGRRGALNGGGEAHPGKRRIRFCSSLSSPSSVLYLKSCGKRGFTVKASFASRMQTLQGRGQRTRSVAAIVFTHTWVMPSDFSVSSSFDTTNEPR